MPTTLDPAAPPAPGNEPATVTIDGITYRVRYRDGAPFPRTAIILHEDGFPFLRVPASACPLLVEEMAKAYRSGMTNGRLLGREQLRGEILRTTAEAKKAKEEDLPAFVESLAPEQLYFLSTLCVMEMGSRLCPGPGAMDAEELG